MWSSFLYSKKILYLPYPKTVTGSLVENTKALSEKLLRNSAKPLPCVMWTRYDGIKLSNSGDTLKLMGPSYSRKAISGWTNYSCTVIIHKMKETEMGNRGSKSDFLTNAVKEQRVDGSWWISYFKLPKLIHLRCTLMGFERNYPIKILSKQLNKLFFYFDSKLFFS